MSSDRGRIPFALLGVLLLVSSAAIAATSQPRPAPSEPAVSKELDRATAESQTAIRAGTMEASRDAARNPVVERADTPAGRVLDETAPFRDSLRVRIYFAVRERLEEIDRRRNGVRVTASLPAVNDTTRLERAKERVHVEEADENGTTMRVRVENVTLTATRDGRPVTERQVSPTMVVGTPVLALHDGVDEYQRKLDAGVQKPGLTQRLTAQLYALVWARGYAQYGGAPISNVVNNQHVALTTNGALLDVQEATFGESDPAGRQTLTRATAKTAGNDLVSGSGLEAGPVTDLLGTPTRAPPDDIEGVQPPEDTPRDEEMTVGVNETADDAFLDLIHTDDLNETITTVYSADARLISEVQERGTKRPGRPSSPGSDWRLAGTDLTTDVSASRGGVDPPATPTGWQRFESYSREVEITSTRTATWHRGNDTTTTSTETTMTRRIAVAVVARHQTSEHAPPGPTTTVYERGKGPLDGPNLADVEGRVMDRLVEERGGPETLLQRAETRSLDTNAVRIEADQPDEVYQWSYRDLMEMRERVRSITVGVERGKVGTFEANPPAQLADRIRSERGRLVGAPNAYDSTATRARYAARAAYLDAVLSRLDEQAENRRARASGFDDALKENDAGSLADARAGAKASRSGGPAPQSTLEGPAGPVSLRVDSAPSYLTRGEVTQERVPAVEGSEHPLAARNVNVFTLPYGDAVDFVFDGLFESSSGHVRLATAARTLRAANATLDRTDDPRVRDRRDALQGEVILSERYVREGMRAELADRGVGESASDRWAIVTDGMNRWDTWDARALAMTNGSASEAVADAADAERSLSTTERDRLELELENRTQEVLTHDEAKPELESVNRSRNTAREAAKEVTKDIAKNATEAGVQKATNRSFDRVPAGLPLAPPISAWYVTTNVWHVTVRGEYARFGVRADRGRPTAPGSDVTYVRDGSPVTLDVDGDGERERLGSSTRVNFDVSSTVVIVVPPGKSGVGDRNGDMVEHSDGWPQAGTG